MSRQIAAIVFFILVVIGATLAVSAWWRRGPARDVDADADAKRIALEESGPPTFVGRQSCRECHEEAYDAWLGSHHDLAMQSARTETVLGDFDDASFERFGVLTSFHTREGRFLVRTHDTTSGAEEEFRVAYVFGVTPLQQYLVEFPDGRFQTLPFCWDARPEEEGGQRWFHIYPDEPIPPGDELHWLGANQNWNFMCAECHSTDLQKHYDLQANRYDTTWFEIDVSCEACHGPGSTHVAWARAVESGAEVEDDGRTWLPVDLGDPNFDAWRMNDETGTAERIGPPPASPSTIVESCGRCHSRRMQIADPYEYDRPLLDTHRLALLTEGLYHADGQILDEVYVYGSFLQSRMYHAGVTCLDCHDAHTLEMRLPGNTVCHRCHDAERYDAEAHHFHQPDTEGAACVDCHMPTRNYMVVDPRLDHSIRIPRPDLTIAIGTPNACNGCHEDQTPAWALEYVREWYGLPEDGAAPHLGVALDAGRRDLPGAGRALAALAEDTEQPAIARATAISMLPDHPGPYAERAIRVGLDDADPLVRFAAAEASEMLDPETRRRVVHEALNDPVRTVRMAAARALADVPPELLTAATRTSIDRGLDEFVRSQLVNAERASSHLNLGLLAVSRGRLDEAERAYRTAIRLEPDWVPAFVNLADLQRVQGRDDACEQTLREALAVAPENASIHHALGLALVRRGAYDEALAALGTAVELNPDDPRLSYVYGIAMNSLRGPDAAVAILLRAHERHPHDRDLLLALATIHRDLGAVEQAIGYAEELMRLYPEEEAYRQLAAELRSQDEVGPGRP